MLEKTLAEDPYGPLADEEGGPLVRLAGDDDDDAASVSGSEEEEEEV